MQVTYTVLVEVFLFDERKVGVALHLCQRLLSRYELLSSSIVYLALIEGAW